MADKRLDRDDAPLLKSKHAATVDAAAKRMDLTVGASVSARTVTIGRPREELFAYFRDFANLPTFMDNVVRVDVIDAARSHWVVKAPGGRTVEWDSVISEEAPPSFFVWTSEGDVANSGRIDFHDAGDRGTTVTASLAYDPPAGGLGKLVAKIFQREPAIQARRDLRRFKQLMETGEVATSAQTVAALAKEKA